MEERKFTKIESEIYEEIVKNIRQQKKETVAQIAGKVNVAPSYVIKVAKKLGYSGINEMWYSLSGIYSGAIDVSVKDFNLTENDQLDLQINALCKMLLEHQDKRIMVNSIGDSDHVGNYLLDKLWYRGFHAVPYKSHLLETNHKISPGILIAINESGVVLLEQCLKASKHDYRIVSLTSNRNSPLANHSHLSIELKNKKSGFYEYAPNFFSAYVLIFLEILFARYDNLVAEEAVTLRKLT